MAAVAAALRYLHSMGFRAARAVALFIQAQLVRALQDKVLPAVRAQARMVAVAVAVQTLWDLTRLLPAETAELG